MQPWNLAELSYEFVATQKYNVAVLPLGCTEPHNLHLPYGTDTFEGEVIGSHVCRAAHEAGGRVVLLPTVPYGTTSNQRECAMSINVYPSTLYAFVTDIVDSLRGHGIHDIVILNSHGGNDMKPLLRELYGKRPDTRLYLVNWYQIVQDIYHEIFEHPEDHAGEMETSIAMAYFPDFVVRNDDGTLVADDGATRPNRYRAINEGWVSITRPWHELTTNTGSGNPHAATADKGRAVMTVIVDRIAPFLVELSQTTR